MKSSLTSQLYMSCISHTIILKIKKIGVSDGWAQYMSTMDENNLNTRLMTDNSWLTMRDSLPKPASGRWWVVTKTDSCC